MQVDQAGPVKGVIRGDEFDGVGFAVTGVADGGLAVGAAVVAMHASGFELSFEGLCLTRGRCGGCPVRSDAPRTVRKEAFGVALTGELRDLGQDADTAGGEAKEAVDLVTCSLIVEGVDRPVVPVE